MWKAPSEGHTEYDKYYKRRREFRRDLLRDFPEWHFDGKFIGETSMPPHGVQFELRKVWELASKREVDKAKRILRKMSEYFSLRAERLEAAFEDGGYSYGDSRGVSVRVEYTQRELENKKAQAMPVKLMVKALDSLQKRLSSLHVCEYPKCANGKKHFFKAYPNQRYCCVEHEKKAKAMRKAPKEYTRPESDIQKIRIGMEKKWAARRRAAKRKTATSAEAVSKGVTHQALRKLPAKR